MKSLLISACLIGRDCKYSGGNNALDAETLSALREKYELIPVCPEADGGLPTPRDPSERVGGRVMSITGRDVTAQYKKGAEIALQSAKENGCEEALLKEKSPSCGAGEIYDGTFSMRLIPGDGVTAELLKANGIKVIGESGIKELIG